MNEWRRKANRKFQGKTRKVALYNFMALFALDINTFQSTYNIHNINTHFYVFASYLFHTTLINLNTVWTCQSIFYENYVFAFRRIIWELFGQMDLFVFLIYNFVSSVGGCFFFCTFLNFPNSEVLLHRTVTIIRNCFSASYTTEVKRREEKKKKHVKHRAIIVRTNHPSPRTTLLVLKIWRGMNL